MSLLGRAATLIGLAAGGAAAARAAANLTPSERALRDSLRVRGVRASTAGYWTAYRLTYLFAERPILVPSAPSEDRYPPYRALLR